MKKNRYSQTGNRRQHKRASKRSANCMLHTQGKRQTLRICNTFCFLNFNSSCVKEPNFYSIRVLLISLCIETVYFTNRTASVDDVRDLGPKYLQACCKQSRFNQGVSHSTNLRSAHTVHLCVLCGSENKQRLVSLTA